MDDRICSSNSHEMVNQEKIDKKKEKEEEEELQSTKDR